MSGAAASAGASKFQAFMNHPAGTVSSTYAPTFACDLLIPLRRTQNRVLLGAVDEMVLGWCWTQRFDTAS